MSEKSFTTFSIRPSEKERRKPSLLLGCPLTELEFTFTPTSRYDLDLGLKISFSVNIFLILDHNEGCNKFGVLRDSQELDLKVTKKLIIN